MHSKIGNSIVEKRGVSKKCEHLGHLNGNWLFSTVSCLTAEFKTETKNLTNIVFGKCY